MGVVLRLILSKAMVRYGLQEVGCGKAGKS